MDDLLRRLPTFASGVKVMISHSNKDAHRALQFASNLKKKLFKAWTYEVSLRFGSSIRKTVEENIRDCDVLIVLLSKSAVRSKWVSRELGLAKGLHATRRRAIPHIIAVDVDEPSIAARMMKRIKQKNDASWRIALRDFHTGKLTGEVIDFSDQRYMATSSPHTDKFDVLVEHITPEIRFFGETPGDSEELPDGWEECYEELFPVDDERDDPEDIRRWMEAEALNGPNGVWQTLFSTMTAFDEVIGFGYFSLHKPTGWVFGNYFGIRKAWRQHRYAHLYLEAIRRELTRRLPEGKGILFEVEPFKAAALADIEQNLGREFAASEIAVIRSLRRLNLYEIYGAKALVTRDGTPVHYRQPAMTDERAAYIEDPERDFRDLKFQECELILLFYPIQEHSLSLSNPEEAIKFLYDEFFLDAYGHLRGYRPYLASLREEILGGVPKGSLWGEAFPRRASRIITHARRSKVEIDL